MLVSTDAQAVLPSAPIVQGFDKVPFAPSTRYQRKAFRSLTRVDTRRLAQRTRSCLRMAQYLGSPYRPQVSRMTLKDETRER